jgi:hypothetical protein
MSQQVTMTERIRAKEMILMEWCVVVALED